MGNDDEALWGRDAVVLLPVEPVDPTPPHPRPPRRSRRSTALVTIGVLVAVAVVVALLGRTSRTRSSDELKVHVRHERFAVVLDAILLCDPARAMAPPGVHSMIIDTWRDTTGRRVRDRITYPDGGTYDLVASGNISLPDAALERGRRQDLAQGCFGDDGAAIAIITPPDLPFALDFTSQLTPEQRSAFAHFHQQGVAGGTALDDHQRSVTTWTAATSGTWAVQGATRLAGRQTWQWSVLANDPHTVTAQWFTNTVDHLGSAARGELLQLSEDTTVTASFFDTTGFHRVAP